MGQNVACVYCRQRPVDQNWRPFCSERCKLLDLRNWVDEQYRIPEEDGSSVNEATHADTNGVSED